MADEVDQALLNSQLRKMAFLNSRKPPEKEMMNKFPKAAQGCRNCNGYGYRANVVVKNGFPYLTAIVCDCMKKLEEG